VVQIKFSSTTEDVITVPHILNHLLQIKLKVSVVWFVKQLNVQKMKLFWRMDHAKLAHPGQCHNKEQESVDQVYVELVRD
jgi:hypothetical protein